MFGNKNNHLFRTIFSSYLILLFLVLMVSAITYSAAYRRIEENTLENHLLLLKQTADSIDQVLQETRGTGMQILATTAADSLLYSFPPLTIYKKMAIGTLQKELCRRIAYNNSISEIYVYFSNPRVCASTSGILYQTAFENVLRDKLGINAETLTSVFRTQKNLLGTTLAGRDGTDYIVVCVFDSVIRQEPSATCLMLINARVVRSILNVGEESGTLSLWLVSGNGVIASPGAGSVPTEVLERIKTEDSFLYDSEDMRCQILHVGLGMADWQLVAAVSTASYHQPLITIQRTFFCVTLACLAAGIVLAILFSKRRANRIQRITRQFMLRLDNNGKNKDELSLLENNMRDLLRENEAFRDSIQQHARELRQMWVVRMLKGRIADPEVFRQICGDYHIDVTSDVFCVVCINIEDYHDAPPGDDAGEDTYDMINYSLDSFAQQFLLPHYNCQSCAFNDSLYCMLNMKESIRLSDENACQIAQTALKNVLTDFVTFAEKTIQVRLRCYVSHLEEGYDGIARAYRETCSQMERIETFSLQGPVFVHKDVDALLPAYQAADNATTIFERLCAAVADNESDLVWPLFKDALSDSLPSGQTDFRYLRGYAIQLLYRLTEALLKDKAQEFLRENRIIEKNADLRKIDEMRKMTCAYSALLTAEIKKEQQEETPSWLVNEFIAYIDSHYADPMLTVYSLADTFRISQSYLLRVVKKALHMGVLDYISQKRVEEAKKLLRETNATVSDIAQRVGYTNSLALIRAFKKNENLTPTAYRKLV